MKLRLTASLGLVAFILGCGGGGSSGDSSTATGSSAISAPAPASPTTTVAESDNLASAWLYSEQQVKLSGYQGDVTQLSIQYGAAVGARTTNNGAIIAGAQAAFDNRLDAFISGYVSYLQELKQSYPLDKAALASALAAYEPVDEAYITQSIEGMGGAATGPASDVQHAYDQGRSLVQSL